MAHKGERPITRLRRILDSGQLIWMQGAGDVISAMIIEKAGFDGVAVQTSQSALVDGLLDTGLRTASEQVDLTAKVCRTVSIPVIADMEQGFGDAYNTVHWLHRFEEAGAAGGHVDDYGHLYKCPWVPPYLPDLEDPDLTCATIRAMAGERRDKDFIIVARSGAHSCTRYTDPEEARQEAVRRLTMFKRAGADVLLTRASTPEEARYFRERLDGPLMMQRSIGGHRQVLATGEARYMDRMEDLTVDEVYALGFQVINEPTTVQTVALQAAYEALKLERLGRGPASIRHLAPTREDVNQWLGVEEATRIRNTYAGRGSEVL